TGLSLAVASSSPRAWVEERLAEVGLSQTFAVVSCRGSGLAAKPAPDVYLDACRRLGVEPARAVAVEDSLNGLAAARAAGMRCVAVPGTITSGLDLGAADLVLGSLGEMSLDDALCHLAERTDR
ncbi:MAG: HAD-IA family hydrolase, partial [Acidimicrobiales bacterium]